jgi:OmpA-OmpF porin, OOP family
MKHLSLYVAPIWALLLTSCSTILPSAEQSPASKNRITDRAIYADQKQMQELQDQLADLNKTKAIALDSYVHAKAQCWLDVAAHEYQRNDRSGFIETALAKTREGLTAMQQGVPTSDAEVSSPLYCSQAERACAEVRQAHADHEERQFGWRHARPYHAIAQDLSAQAKAKTCIAQVATVVVAKPAPPDAVVAVLAGAAVAVPAKSTVITKFVLQSDALFAFDRSGEKDLSNGGKARLTELTAKLKSLDLSIYNIKVTGFADRLGSDNYNRVLSENRAQTIRNYLVKNNVPANKITALAGPKNPDLSACSMPDRNLQIACLAADRRVEIEVSQ